MPSSWARSVAIVLALVATGCGSSKPAAPPEAERIVSLVPSVTDFIVALDEHDRLVARTRYDTIPLLGHLPAIGGTLDPSIEKLVDLEPDLVITGFPNQDGDVSGNLARTGVTTLRVHAETLDDVRKTLIDLGNRMGIRRRTDSLLAAIHDSLNAVRASSMRARAPSVFFVTWVSPPMTVGPRTFVHELIEAAGGHNVFADVPSNWPTVSIEAVLQRDPDVIVLPVAAGDSSALAELRQTPGFQNLRAVREGHMYLVDRDLFSRPGPRMHEAARLLSRYLSALKEPRSARLSANDTR